MKITMEQVAESVDAISKLVTDIQTEVKSHGEVSATVTKMQEALEPMLETHEKMATAITAGEAKAVEDAKRIDNMEVFISKLPSGSQGKQEVDIEFIEKFATVLELTTERNLDRDFFEESATKLFEYHSRGLSTKRKEILKAMLVGSNPDGGYYAPVDMSSQIHKRIFETSPLRSIANVVSTMAEAWSCILDDQEASAGWVGEVSARPETATPQIGEIIIPTHEMYANPAVSQKTLDDAIFNVVSWLTGKLSEKFGRLENAAFINGDGSLKPTGILTLPDWTSVDSYKRDALGTRTTATSLTIGADDLIKVQGDLFEPYQPRAVWAMHRKVWIADVVTLKDDEDRYLLNPLMMFQGADTILLGKKVVLMGDMPSNANAAGAYGIMYGDFKEGYTIVDRIGMRILRDPFTNKPFIHFYSTKRVGGKVTNFQAIKRLKTKA